MEIKKGVMCVNLRKATLIDYGVPPDDIPLLQSHFRKLEDVDKFNLMQIAVIYAPGIWQQIFDSIVNCIGYRTMERTIEIPVSEKDFYAYKRKVMAEYYHLAKLTGRL